MENETSSKSLEGYLEDARKSSQSEALACGNSTSGQVTSPSEGISRAIKAVTIDEGLVRKDKQGLLDRWEMRREQSKQELEKARTIFSTQLNLIKHQAAAAERESESFWNAKSAEVAETIKSYVQATMRSLDNARMDSRNNALMEAYERAQQSLDKAFAMKLPDKLKGDLIARINAQLEQTVQRIADDALAESYGLK